MTYTRQTFEMVAKTIADGQDASMLTASGAYWLAIEFANKFAETNTRFDHERFYAACGVSDEAARVKAIWMTYPNIIETRRGNPYAPKIVRPDFPATFSARILANTNHIGRGTL